MSAYEVRISDWSSDVCSSDLPAQVVAEIEAGRFGVAYRGSSLETVVHSVAEQRQIFKGADHAFLWKPKLRIPDIYENPANQRAFGRLLDHCACCDTAEEIIAGIHTHTLMTLNSLGPADATHPHIRRQT